MGTKPIKIRPIPLPHNEKKRFPAGTSVKKPEGDNPTIGILLGTDIETTDVKYSIMADCERLFATKLMPYMPTRAELEAEIEHARVRSASIARRKALPSSTISAERSAP